MEILKKTIDFHPAYDKRDPDPNKNYGIHGVEIKFILKGPEGAVQFLLFTNWQLPHVEEEFLGKIAVDDDIPRAVRLFALPLPADLGYHSPHPMFDGHEPMGGSRRVRTSENGIESTEYEEYEIGEFKGKLPKWEKVPIEWVEPCPIIGKVCYYDGSTLNAERYYNILRSEGSEGLWKALEEYYNDIFKEDILLREIKNKEDKKNE